MTYTNQITDCIEHSFNIGGIDYSKKIIVFPCGDIGIQVLNIMKSIYSLEPAYLIDNHKCKFNPNIHDSSFLKDIDCHNHVLILASINHNIYPTLKESVLKYFPEENILELQVNKTESPLLKIPPTKIGKYSYGPICCNHIHIASIGAFCSFADGVSVVGDHETHYLSTHNMLFSGARYEDEPFQYNLFKDEPWYVPSIQPKPTLKKRKRSIIGNDVWLGKNVIIANYANIGNGVIAGAGAVITKDVPDYAVVVGVPARIIKYRYTPEQIKSLNKIAWWDWTDDEIRERFDDFYLSVDDFIEKYK